MISAGDFRNGVTIEVEGVVYQILEFQHVKPVRVLLLSALSLRTLSMAV